jgi:FAD/FMN-containing dehydrogenase
MAAPDFAAFLFEAEKVVGAQHLLRDEANLQAYGRDWTRVFEPNPTAIILPKTTEEVSGLMKLACKHHVAVVPSGGRTGLAAGAVAANGEVVLSLTRMNAIGEVDALGMTVTCQAGAVTQAVHEHCERVGLTWPVDFASKGSSHVGGNIATNAGGVRVIRYGLTRQWVLALEVVLADGTVLHCGGALEKNNTGLDWRQLFIGSEGTLGIVTQATLKLCPMPKNVQVALFSLPDLASVLVLFEALRKRGLTLGAYEFFTEACLQRVLKHRALKRPFAEPSSHYVLVEAEGEDALPAFVEAIEQGLARDAVVAQHSKEASELWSLRESISESLSATGFPHKNDISLPLAALRSFVADLEQLFAESYPAFEICLFGHIGDGNLHLNVMKPEAMTKDVFLAAAKTCDPMVFALVKKHQGSISAEHGIGLLKRDYLHFTRSPAEVLLMRQVKHALDPNNLLNPGKVLPTEIVLPAGATSS